MALMKRFINNSWKMILFIIGMTILPGGCILLIAYWLLGSETIELIKQRILDKIRK